MEDRRGSDVQIDRRWIIYEIYLHKKLDCCGITRYKYLFIYNYSIPGYFHQHMLAYGKYTMSTLDTTRKMVNYA